MTFSDQTNEADAITMIERFAAAPPGLLGERAELDTARVYNDGKTEEMLGEIITGKLPPEVVGKLSVATKANPKMSLSAEGVLSQMAGSLAAMKAEDCDLYYLHMPDSKVPIEETLEAVQKLYEQGKFKRFGLSNYTAWEVVYIHSYMKSKGWVLPVIYQVRAPSLRRID